MGYRANLWLRSAIRVLLLLGETVLDGRRPAGEEVRLRGGCRLESLCWHCGQPWVLPCELRKLLRVPTTACSSTPPPPPPLRSQVYDAFRAAANWAQLLPSDQTFSVESRVWSCSNLTSSQVGWVLTLVVE